MSDDGDKTCPLCAEEMDLTDQQLKPCKCGYEICVWCWHHIMEMAEKDETEGRCPACRTPYDKEKIVGTGANCERLVAEVSSERKVKPQKTKTKTSEGRKQLSSVRVIQRNLVYIVGLPLNLADEDLLQRREYFGQYGKVLKVSMSRTTAGAIQQFPNSTCSVYITYAKEEEAVRCIQLVHGFILDGRTLRACFGTTKYCHAWLRNVACTNPDCLYLHEVGSQEDSFTKDEIVSAFTRDRVQQITGGTNNMQQRSGSVLPPPAVDYCNSTSASTGKPILKNAPNTTTPVARGSPPNGSSSKSLPLPAAAAWGAQTSNCQPSPAGLTCSNGHAKSKSNETTVTSVFSAAVVASTSQASLSPSGTVKKPTLDEESHSTLGKVKADPLKSLKHANLDSPTDMPKKSVTPDGHVSSLTSNDRLSALPHSKDNDRGTSRPLNIANSIDHSDQSASLDAEKGDKNALNRKTQNLSSYMSSMSIDRNTSERTGVSSSSSFTDHGMTKHPSQALQQYYAEEYREPLTSNPTSEPVPAQFGTYSGVCVSAEQSNWDSDLNTQVSNSYTDVEEDILSFDCQRLKDPEVVNHLMPLPDSTNLMHGANHCRAHSLQQSEAAVNLNIDPLFVDTSAIDRPHLYASNVSTTSNGPPGYRENSAGAASLSRTLEHSFLHSKDGKEMQMERLQGGGSNGSGMSIDKGENSIISNILSMDFDVWGDTFTSPQNLAKLLGGSDEQSGPGKIPSPWKAQNSSQSRFSFARQEEPRDKPFDSDPSFSGVGQLNRNRSFSQNFAENGDSFVGKPGIGNVFSCSKFEGLDNFGCNQSAFSSSKLSAASRGHISAPPGFSAPSRAPPPGFSAQERMDQTFDPMSGSHLLDTSALFRNSYQAPPPGNLGNTGDIEFMDPAILAVGKGRPQGGLNNAGLDMRSNFSQLSAFENEARLQLLMQRSVSQQPGLRYPDIGDGYSPLNDPYGISSRLMDQSHVNSLSPYPQLSLQQQSRNAAMSNGHWNRWSEVQNGNNVGMAELLRNERPGFNKFYTGYEDSKFQMPSSGDMYNRTFGM